MRESYCGLCDDCQLGNRGFLETVFRLKEYLARFRANWWVHCFPEEEGFDFGELRKGLDWFLSHTECPGCKGGRGLEDCPIRNCAISRGLEHCSQCPDLGPCTKFDFLLKEFPDVKINLRRRQLKLKAQEFHRQLESYKK
ncbi:MAG: DUF3795 domain-containing protein [Deltaproteobacteria bacterium]|nr:DUF3795 domain-containing protein [Deltaproteobacteria bacterium]